MTSSRFEVDDIAVSDRGTVILARGKRRIALHKLNERQVALLVEAARSRELPAGADADAIVAKLRQIDFPFDQAGARQHRLRVNSRVVAAFARPLALLAHPLWICLFLLVGVLNASLVAASFRPLLVFDILFGTPLAFAGFLAGTWATIALHEAGHAAACLRATGMVGGIRMKLHWGIPAVATDVSAIAMAPARDRKWINLAGPAWHMAASVLIYYACRDAYPAVATGALVSLPVAFVALLPMPGFDGFWILQDALGRRIAGPLRRPRAGDIAAPVYCWVLLAVLPAWLLASVYILAQFVIAGAASASAQGTLIVLLSLVSVASAGASLWALGRFLMTAEGV